MLVVDSKGFGFVEHLYISANPVKQCLEPQESPGVLSIMTGSRIASGPEAYLLALSLETTVS